MNYHRVERDGKAYIECLAGQAVIRDEQDALEWVGICGEYETHRLLLPPGSLTDDFYQLKTGVAGRILLKFVTYQIKVAAVLTPEQVNQGRFQEMVLETNRGSQFRVFYDVEKAAQWLLSD